MFNNKSVTDLAVQYKADQDKLKENFVSKVSKFILGKKEKVAAVQVAITDLEVSKNNLTADLVVAEKILKETK